MKELAFPDKMHMIRPIKGMTAADTSHRKMRTAEPTIAAPFVRALLELAVAKGAGRRALLQRSGIDPVTLDDRDARMPLEQWVLLMRAAAEACGDPALALHFGEAFDVGDMSVVGLLPRAAETKGEGMQLVNRFCHLVADVETEGEERFRLVRDDGGTWVIDTRLNPNQTPEVSEASFAQMATMGQRMMPGVRHIRAVHFTHPSPSYRAEYDRIFQVPVVFDSDRNGFLMPDGWEAEPIALQPRYALEILSAHAEGLLERLEGSGSTAGRVEAMLAPMLARGKFGAGSVAAALGLSPQALYRKLKAEGATFEKLLEGLRRRLAVHYLDDRKLSAKETGYRLGFSDPSSFSRAFKRWTGSSPSAYRRERAGD